MTVSHGLGATPAYVTLFPLGSNQGGNYYINTVGSTTFKLNLGATASANRDFYWEAKVGRR